MNTQYQADLQRELEQSNYDAIVNGIAAAQSDAENAQLRLQQAWAANDLDAAAEEQRRLSRAEARLVSLETGKDQYDARVVQAQNQYAQQAQQQPQQLSPDQIIAGMTQLTPREREWLMQRKHLVTNPNKVTQLQAAYMEAQEKGIQRDSDAYFAHFEDRVGGSNSNGLTAAQRDACKISGCDESTYAQMVRKMYAEQQDTRSLYGSLGRR